MKRLQTIDLNGPRSICEVAGCDKPADYDNWADVMLGDGPHLLQLTRELRRVCVDHRNTPLYVRGGIRWDVRIT